MKRWRWILPALNIVLYIILIGASQQPKIPSDISIELVNPIDRRIADSVNSPAAVLALIVANRFGENTQLVADILTGIFLLPQWWLVGLWADYRGRHCPISLSRYQIMTFSATAFSIVLLI